MILKPTPVTNVPSSSMTAVAANPGLSHPPNYGWDLIDGHLQQVIAQTVTHLVNCSSARMCKQLLQIQAKYIALYQPM